MKRIIRRNSRSPPGSEPAAVFSEAPGACPVDVPGGAVGIGTLIGLGFFAAPEGGAPAFFASFLASSAQSTRTGKSPGAAGATKTVKRIAASGARRRLEGKSLDFIRLGGSGGGS